VAAITAAFPQNRDKERSVHYGSKAAEAKSLYPKYGAYQMKESPSTSIPDFINKS